MGDKARFYRYARRSATETAAATVVLGARGLISVDDEIHMRRLLLSAIKSLTRRPSKRRRPSVGRPA